VAAVIATAVGDFELSPLGAVANAGTAVKIIVWMSNVLMDIPALG
jgi:hypothetical protein